VLISCYKHTSRISQLIVMFVMMAALLSQGKIFYKYIYSKISKKKSLFKHIGKFHKQCRSHTLCIPKYEQYQVRTYCQNVSMVEVPTIFARWNQPSKNTPPPFGNFFFNFLFFPYHGKSDFVALYVEHAKSDKVALCLRRSPRRSFKKLRYILSTNMPAT